jgi:hypothetical protein
MKGIVVFAFISILAACGEQPRSNVADGVCIDADEFGLIWRPCESYRADGSCEYLFLKNRYVAPRALLVTREQCLGDDSQSE